MALHGKPRAEQGAIGARPVFWARADPARYEPRVSCLSPDGNVRIERNGHQDTEKSYPDKTRLTLSALYKLLKGKLIPNDQYPMSN